MILEFEAEVIPMFIIGCIVVSIAELVIGLLLLRKNRAAQICFTAHVVSMAIALFCLVRCIFANWLDIEYNIPSISNSENIGLFGVFWTVSVVFALAVIYTLRKKNDK